MVEVLRNNCYDGCVIAKDMDDYKDPDLYWPTDKEFVLIANTLMPFLTEENEAHVYGYLAEHLQELAQGYQMSLTREMVLETFLKSPHAPLKE